MLGCKYIDLVEINHRTERLENIKIQVYRYIFNQVVSNFRLIYLRFSLYLGGLHFFFFFISSKIVLVESSQYWPVCLRGDLIQL